MTWNPGNARPLGAMVAAFAVDGRTNAWYDRLLTGTESDRPAPPTGSTASLAGTPGMGRAKNWWVRRGGGDVGDSDKGQPWEAGEEEDCEGRVNDVHQAASTKAGGGRRGLESALWLLVALTLASHRVMAVNGTEAESAAVAEGTHWATAWRNGAITGRAGGADEVVAVPAAAASEGPAAPGPAPVNDGGPDGGGTTANGIGEGDRLWCGPRGLSDGRGVTLTADPMVINPCMGSSGSTTSVGAWEADRGAPRLALPIAPACGAVWGREPTAAAWPRAGTQT